MKQKAMVMIITSVLLASILLTGCLDIYKPKEYKTPNTIEVLVYEDPENPDYLKRDIIAEVIISEDGDIKLNIIEDDPETERLKKAIEEIINKSNLTLVYENVEDDILVMYAEDITKEHPKYIHAVNHELEIMYGFLTRPVYKE